MYSLGNRRSVRQYTEETLGDAELKAIVRDAMRAPTCGNMQLYSVVASRSPEMKELLSPCHFGQPMVKGCAAVLTVCADFSRFSRWCRLSQAEPGYDNLMSLMLAMADAHVFAQQIVTAAETRGWGTCYLGTVLYNAAEIAEALHLPELCVPVACITVGRPAEDGEETERLPVEAVLHQETYRHDSDEELMRLYETKDQYPPNARYIEENGKQTLAQVYTDVRYPKAVNEEFSDKFGKFLKSSGFLK